MRRPVAMFAGRAASPPYVRRLQGMVFHERS
jgi:hypothetical protein